MRSAVAAICLLFVTGFLPGQDAGVLRLAVARATCAHGEVDRSAESASRTARRHPEPARRTSARCPRESVVPRALGVRSGGLPKPRAPDASA